MKRLAVVEVGAEERACLQRGSSGRGTIKGRCLEMVGMSCASPIHPPPARANQIPGRVQRQQPAQRFSSGVQTNVCQTSRMF
jgi:hypothetical protein